jgi:hypothetical protein
MKGLRQATIRIAPDARDLRRFLGASDTSSSGERCVRVRTTAGDVKMMSMKVTIRLPTLADDGTAR